MHARNGSHDAGDRARADERPRRRRDMEPGRRDGNGHDDKPAEQLGQDVCAHHGQGHSSGERARD